MLYDIHTDIIILFISPNPWEFGRLGQPHFKREGMCETLPQKTGSVSLNILEHARILESPPNPLGSGILHKF